MLETVSYLGSLGPSASYQCCLPVLSVTSPSLPQLSPRCMQAFQSNNSGKANSRVSHDNSSIPFQHTDSILNGQRHILSHLVYGTPHRIDVQQLLSPEVTRVGRWRHHLDSNSRKAHSEQSTSGTDHVSTYPTLNQPCLPAIACSRNTCPGGLCLSSTKHHKQIQPSKKKIRRKPPGQIFIIYPIIYQSIIPPQILRRMQSIQ